VTLHCGGGIESLIRDPRVLMLLLQFYQSSSQTLTQSRCPSKHLPNLGGHPNTYGVRHLARAQAPPPASRGCSLTPGRAGGRSRQFDTEASGKSEVRFCEACPVSPWPPSAWLMIYSSSKVAADLTRLPAKREKFATGPVEWSRGFIDSKKPVRSP